MRLLAFPILDVGGFPLHLPAADAINSGGCLSSGSVYCYSPIDLLAAGLEAVKHNLIVSDLVRFFDKYKVLDSFHEVYLTYENNKNIYTHSIARIRDMEIRDEFKKHAPLCFKWRTK